MNNVVVVGSINMDLTSYLDRWPQVGETVTAQNTIISLGGKGANQAVAASCLGATVTMIGAVGTDSFGHDVEARLSDADITLHLHRPAAVSTGMAFIDVGPDGDNLIRLSAGANATLQATTISDLWSAIADCKVLLLQNEVPIEASLEAARFARAAGAIVVMDPAPAPVPFWSHEQLTAFDILTPNALEVKSITGHEPRTLEEALKAAQHLKSFGARGSIVTMGPTGVAWSIADNEGRMDAPDVNAIDTVGAGDCFNGAFACAIAADASIDKAVEMAVNAAALATTRNGASDSVPTKAELEHRFSPAE
ncbi:MAG: ribokinase [Stappiaceae bacterium]